VAFGSIVRVSIDPRYSLALSPDEVERYRFMAQIARADETAAWAEAGIVPGARIADLGCGPGLLLAELADVVGPSGRVAGIDRQDAAIATARQVIADGGLDHASAQHGDAWDSGLELGVWDLVNIRHVLAHNTAANVARIVEHAFALLRPEGTLYLLDVDLSGLRVVPRDDDIDDLSARYLRHLGDTGRDATIGPRLGAIVVAGGFAIVSRHQTIMSPPREALTVFRPPAWAAREAMRETGHANDADIERWDRALTRFATDPPPEAAIFAPVYAVIARRTRG
jgi:SAM-dependent methyltransferase